MKIHTASPFVFILTNFRIQLNDKEIDEPIKNLPVYMNKIGSYQKRIYDKIIENFQTKSDTLPLSDSAKNMPTFENMESFGYTLLKEPLESLNIVFPNMEFDALKEDDLVNPNLISSMVGKKGLSNIMTYETEYKPNEIRFNYEYKPEIEENYGKIFELSNLEKYSSKIFEICNIVKKSKGPIIIYKENATAVKRILVAWGQYNRAKCGWTSDQRKGKDGRLLPWLADEILNCTAPDTDEFEEVS